MAVGANFADLSEFKQFLEYFMLPELCMRYALSCFFFHGRPNVSGDFLTKDRFKKKKTFLI